MEYLAGPNVITRQGQGVRVSEGDVTVEAEIRFSSTGLEGGGRGPETTHADGLKKPDKTRERILRASRRNQPC